MLTIPELLYQSKRQGIDLKLSISAVSGNRKFTKALVRYSSEIDALRNAAISYNSNSLPFDTLQIVFFDRDESYLRAVGCKKDRLFQVEVATPDENRIDYSRAKSLIRAIAEKLILALESTHIESEEKSVIALLIETAVNVE